MSENQKDEDLDELLDSALQDFDRIEKKSEKNQDDSTKENEQSTNNSDPNEPSDPNAFFEEHAKMLAERMKTLFSGEETAAGDMPPLPQDADQMLAGIKKIAEAAASTLEGSNPASDDDCAKCFDSISQALKGLQEGADQLNQPPEDNLFNMLANLNMDGGDGSSESNMFLPFMEGLIQNLLSAEILLPGIKELVEKYPKYLEENADKLTPEEKERYEKQLELYKVIESHLEDEKPDDPPSVKREKFHIALEDMRKLKDLGQPPEEILSETASGLPNFPPLDDNLAAGGGPQCPTM